MIGLTDEEMRMVKLYVLLPIVLTVFERDKRIMQEKVKTPGPYIKLLDEAMDKVTKDLANVRRKMRAAGIRVVEEERAATAAVVKTVCRGYEQSHSFWWENLKSETETKMSEYLGMGGFVDNV